MRRKLARKREAPTVPQSTGGKMPAVSRHTWAGALAAAMVLMAVLFAGATTPAQAGPPEDAVLDWNAYASDALMNAPTAAIPGLGEPPPVAILGFAMAQGAVFDAVNMIDGGYEPYLDDLPSAPASASKPAAVAVAAHDVLVGVVRGVPLAPLPAFPGLTQAIVDDIVERLDDRLEESLAAIPEGTPAELAAKSGGIAAGAAAASEMLRVRANDGRLDRIVSCAAKAQANGDQRLPLRVRRPPAPATRTRGSPGSSPSCSRARRSSERRAARAHERRLRQGVRRGQGLGAPRASGTPSRRRSRSSSPSTRSSSTTGVPHDSTAEGLYDGRSRHACSRCSTWPR